MAIHEDLEIARQLLSRAGEQLRDENPAVSLRSFQSAAEHSVEASLPEQELEARFGAARCLELLQRVPEAIGELEMASTRAQELQSPGGFFEAASRLGSLYLSQGNWESALLAAERTRDLSRELGDRHNEVASVGLIGQIHRRRGDLEESMNAALDGLALAQEIGDVDEELAFLADLCLISLRQENHERVDQLATRGLERAREHGREEHVPVFLGQLCQVARARGDRDRGRELAEEGLEAARAAGDPKEQAVFLQDLAMVLEDEQRYPEAIERFQESLDLLGALANREGLVLGYRRMSLLLCLAGETVRGMAALAHALTLAFPVSPQLFQETFSVLFQATSVPWARRDFAALLEGLAQMDTALARFEDQIEPSEKRHLRILREVVEVLSRMAESGGDGAGELAASARRLAGEVDAELGCDLAGYLEAGYRVLTRS